RPTSSRTVSGTWWPRISPTSRAGWCNEPTRTASAAQAEEKTVDAEIALLGAAMAIQRPALQPFSTRGGHRFPLQPIHESDPARHVVGRSPERPLGGWHHGGADIGLPESNPHDPRSCRQRGERGAGQPRPQARRRSRTWTEANGGHGPAHAASLDRAH